MDILQGLFLVLIGMGAGFVQRVSGFGLGIFAMIFLPHFLPTHTAAATVSSLFSCITSPYNAIRYRKNIAYRYAVPMIAAALFSIPVAVYFASVVPGRVFELLLGLILVLLSIYFLFFNRRIHIKPNMKNGMTAGALGGILSGLFSTGGPPVVLYLSHALKDNMTYFATVQFYFCFTNLYATSMRVINKLITEEILLYAGVGIIGCLVGDAIGKKVFDKLDGVKLKKVIYIGMIVSGIFMILPS